MLKIGLTGGIGSGKSTVAEMFSNLGITVIDADIIAHQLTQSGTDSFKAIKQLLGEEFITKDGELDRKKIAQTIFSNPSKKITLEKILHPRIKQRMLQEIEQAKSSHYIILVIPLLLESDFTDLVDRIIVIDADDDLRIKRTQQRDDRTEEQIKDIMSHQLDREHPPQPDADMPKNKCTIKELSTSVNCTHKK